MLHEMKKLMVIIYILPWIMMADCTEYVNDTESMTNSSDPNKDMYVIHAMVYQVGILTNKTDNETANFNASGDQEALTFYHHNGSQVDLSQIPEPFLTNVTAHSLVGVAPVSSNQSVHTQIPWDALNHLTNTPFEPNQDTKQMPVSMKVVRDVHGKSNFVEDTKDFLNNFYRSLFKRDISSDTPVEIHKGSSVIPQMAGVQSLAIPPLLTLNNNLSRIPVPIPNTSVVHYSKINTLLTKPED